MLVCVGTCIFVRAFLGRHIVDICWLGRVGVHILVDDCVLVLVYLSMC